MANRLKGIAILGSTGSIGTQTLEVVRAFSDRFRVVALAAGKNVSAFREQVAEFHPPLIHLEGGPASLPHPPLAGSRFVSMEEMVCHPEVELVVLATVGAAGLSPILAALTACKAVALANKEVIIMAGELVTGMAQRHKAPILPVDSEPSAIWQCLQGEQKQVSRLILTASGGPFRKTPLDQLAQVAPQEALRHPTWRMGRKITVDSATLMNKGFEVIEAHWLFGVPMEQIHVVVHPQSIVHSLVEFTDRSVKAQLGLPDMRLPIQYALFHPKRPFNPALPALDLEAVGSLTFEPLDTARYPCFTLALEAGRKGGTYPAALSAADEVAVESFLSGRMGFLDIPRLVEATLASHQSVEKPSLEEILDADRWARDFASRWLERRP